MGEESVSEVDAELQIVQIVWQAEGRFGKEGVIRNGPEVVIVPRAHVLHERLALCLMVCFDHKESRAVVGGFQPAQYVQFRALDVYGDEIEPGQGVFIGIRGTVFTRTLCDSKPANN